MAAFPKFPLWTDAYLGDTTHLTTIEHGAYLLLLITMWRAKDNRLSADDKTLARYARLNKAQWARMKPVILAFFHTNDGFLTQGRLTDEATAVKQHSLRQSNRARHKYLKNKDWPQATAQPEPSRDSAPYPYPYPGKGSKEVSNQERASPEGESHKKSSSKINGSRLSENWTPTAEDREYAFGLELDPEATAEEFRDYWLAKAGANSRKVNWGLAWKSWCRKAKEYKANGKQARGGNGFAELIRTGKV